MIISIIIAGIILYGRQTNQTTQMNHSNETDQKILQETLKLSKDGKTINSESFGFGSSQTEIEKRWGKPDEDDNPGSKGKKEVVYKEKGIKFMYDYSQKVHFIETFDKRLINKISLSKVRETLGKPDSEGNDESNYRLELYYDNLVFTFLVPNDKNPDPKIMQVYIFAK